MIDIFTPFEKKEKKRMASRTRLYYHEQKLKRFQDHLKQGTYPKRVRLSPYPKMKTPKGQALIDEACDEVKQIMLIQMIAEAPQALAQEQKVYKSLEEKKPKTKEEKQAIKIKTLQKELNCMRAQLSDLLREKDIKNECLPKVNQSTQYGELDGVTQNLPEQVFSPQTTSESSVTTGYEFGESRGTHSSRTDLIDG